MEEIDFDPTTEEGQVDINEEDALIEQASRDPGEFHTNLWLQRGREGAERLLSRLKDRFKKTHPYEKIPEYFEMDSLDSTMKAQDPIEMAKKRLLELYENFDFDQVKLSERGGKVFIQFENQKQPGKWTKAEQLLTNEGEVRERVVALRGFMMASGGLLGRLEVLNARIAAEKRVEELEKEKKEEFKELRKVLQAMGVEQNELLLNSHGMEHDMRERLSVLSRERDQARKAHDLALQELGELRVQVDRGKIELDGIVHERDEVLRELNIKEEQLRQVKQALEDSEREAERLLQMINDGSRPEEEREAAQRELEALQERAVELRKQNDDLEREIGLTTKEKIKRALVKYGVPLASAVAISSVVGVILTSMKGVGSGVKKVGKGLAALGKRMAASLPGLLGSVIALVLRTGGELLKFVGNNIWILVVAVGAIILKKLKAF